jgi:hypothetical protein
MEPDITKLIMTTDRNAFKNESVQRSNIAIPASIPASSSIVRTVTFELNESANFIQVYIYATDYGDYFNFLDSKYHDGWRPINNSTASGSGDFLIFTSGGLYDYAVRISINGREVTATAYFRNISGSPITVNHPTYLIPITFIEYTLER